MYTHWNGDTHQDHITTLNSTLAASRLISNVYCYEQVPLPRVCINHPIINHYVDITSTMNTKISCSKSHISQIEKYAKSGIDLIHNFLIHLF